MHAILCCVSCDTYPACENIVKFDESGMCVVISQAKWLHRIKILIP